MKLRNKLTVTTLSLVLISVLAVAGVTFHAFYSSNRKAVALANESLEIQTIDVLMSGARTERETVGGLVKQIENDAKKLGNSPNLTGYLEAREGRNQLWNSVAMKEPHRIVEGIMHACTAQQAWLQQALTRNLALAEYVLSSHGQITVTESPYDWKAVNQLTKETAEVQLPCFNLGDKPLEPNADPARPSILVDEVSNLAGGTCTVFQRMNDAGDMLRVATTVIAASGKRAIGTYIPAVNPDGEPNPVIAEVMTGNTYQGRAFVVDAWCQTAYKPLLNTSGDIIGMLYVGIKEHENADLVEGIVKTKIGKAGYPFIMDSKGVLLAHPKKTLVGKNTITDLKLDVFKEILEKRSEEQTLTLNYTFEDRDKFVLYQHFKPWDWIICASGYWNELSADAADSASKMLVKEIQELHKIADITAGKTAKPLYNQIRILDAKGMELYKLEKGQLSADLKDKSNMQWFKDAVQGKPGEICIAPLEVAANTGLPELRVSYPVFLDGQLKAVASLNMDWQVTRDLFSIRTYGKTGYPYIINSQGVLVTHPKHTLKDNVNLGDSKHGAMADVVRGHMLKGETGHARYSFDGVDKYAVYNPLNIGPHLYCVAVTEPVEEATSLSDTIAAQGNKEVRAVAVQLLLSMLIVLVVAAGVGLLTSSRISKPLRNTVAVLKDIAEGEGDLTKRLTVATKDEVGDVARWFNTFLDKLQGIMQKIAANTATLNNSSTSLAATATDLAGGARETTNQSASVNAGISEVAGSMTAMASSTQQMSDSIKTVAAAVEEMTASIGEVAHNAEQAASVADSAARLAETSNQNVAKLGEAADEIGKIIVTIQDIAEQTNLLALNATIEAARAGDAGKGFAVVANEVKELAKQTAEATDNIRKSIEGIQGSINETVQSISEIGHAIKNVNDVSRSIASAVEEQSITTKEIAQNVAQSATAANTVSSGVAQSADACQAIVEIVREVDQVAQKTAEGASYTQTAGAELSSVAAELKTLVGQFKV